MGADLKEYPEVLERLVDGPAVSSSSGSGTARFFPFGSLAGSFMVRAGVVDGAFRRGLCEQSRVSRVKTGDNKNAHTACCCVENPVGLLLPFPFLRENEWS